MPVESGFEAVDAAQGAAPDFRKLFETSAHLQAVLTPELNFAAATDAYCRATNVQRDAILGRNLFDVFPENPDEPEGLGGRALRDSLKRCVALRRADTMPIVKYDIARSAAEGGGFEERHWSVTSSPVLNDSGAVAWIVLCVEDVTAQISLQKIAHVKTEQAKSQQGVIEQLHATSNFLAVLLDNLPQMLAVKSLPDYRFVLLNKATERIMGVDRGELLGKTVQDLYAPGESDGIAAADRAAVDAGAPVLSQHTVTTRNNRLRTLRSLKVPVMAENGQPEYLIGLHEDITEQIAIEEQLRQAVKMEAVGQLTGGIAHDFNNLLGVLYGNLEMAAEYAGANAALQGCIAGALKATERGADLTQRLLAFSRKQPLRPVPIDLNKNLRQDVGLLERALGERFKVELYLGEAIWPVVADAAQVNEALLNLAINSRDATSGAGTLTIETANAHLDADYATVHPEVVPGDYVQLSVSDNGAGMSRETLEHCFEPFFTTKGVNKGSGLGLSMVYGFVKQSGGHIKIYSELGRGTSVKIYLPRASSEPDEVGVSPEVEVPRGTASVLVVEDGEDLRRLTVRHLRELGYQTLQADSAEAALGVLAENPELDLLFTDVVMPGDMTGDLLAKEALRRYPRLKVLLTSGFPARSSAGGFGEISDLALLPKPFRKKDLAEAVRRVLEGSDVTWQ